MTADLTSLAERLEGATEGSRELDTLILCAFPPVPFVLTPDPRWAGIATFKHENGDSDSRTAPDYTRSVDAALALVGRKLPGWCPRFFMLTRGGGWGADLYNENSDALWRSDAPTAPLAILLSLVRALSNPKART